MAKKQEANVNTTEMEVPETLTLDAPKAEPVEDIPVFKDDARAAIFAKRRQQMDDEIAAQNPPAEEPEEVIEDPIADEPVVATEEKPEQPAEPTASEPQKYKLVVDGQQIEYTIEELVQQAQLGTAARKRFEEAAQMRKEAQELVASRNSQPQAADTTPKQPDIPNEELRDIAKRMNYGTEEEQVAALREAIQLGTKLGQPTLTRDEVIQAATQNALATMTAQQEQAVLSQEFKDIISDPPLAQATDVIATQLAQKYAALGQQKPRIELLREAGNLARERYIKPPVQTVTAAAPTVALGDKFERKRAAPKPPETANKVATEAPPKYGVNPSSIVNQMRKARGQPVF